MTVQVCAVVLEGDGMVRLAVYRRCIVGGGTYWFVTGRGCHSGALVARSTIAIRSKGANSAG